MQLFPLKSLNIASHKTKLKKLKHTVNNNVLMLTDYGLYKFNHQNLTVYKLNLESENELVVNYVDNHDFYVVKNKWNKHNITYQMPVEHHIVKPTIHSYFLYPKSNLKFVIEEVDGAISDYYFITNEPYDNLSVKEDIRSFLQLLK